MLYNVIRDGDVLMVDSFMDLKKYLDSIVTMSSLNTGHNGGGIHKLIVKNSKCSLTIDEIKRCLKASIFDELKEIEVITEDERFRTIDRMLSKITAVVAVIFALLVIAVYVIQDDTFVTKDNYIDDYISGLGDDSEAAGETGAESGSTETSADSGTDNETADTADSLETAE